MKLKKHFLAVMLFCAVVGGSFAQEIPKRELRATWIASVENIDWPKRNTSMSTQKAALISILDKLESANMTTAFLQVRPMADALYKSKYEPWSQYLTGTRGKDPGYDPLAFALEEAHKRGIEVHVWMNPYRYETGSMNHGSNDYVRKNHPEWILNYSDRRILDPGNPEVRQFITNIVEDIVTNYNIDGVIFDDYYYPYSGTTNEDAYSQALYKDPSMNVGDWRRENVNELIAGIYAMIQKTKSTVKFSQGPFGIWGANATVAKEYGIEYLNTSGGTNAYESIYCDAVRWLKDKTIDFLSPQCYWPSTNTKPWGYTTLVPWWSGVAKTMDRHFYSSMRMGTMGTRSTLETADASNEKYAGLSHLEMSMISSEGPILRSAATDECDYEVDLNRSSNLQGAPGHVFFNTTQFISYGFPEHLRAGKFSTVALPPVMTWKMPTALANLTEVAVNDTNILSWAGETKDTDRFAIYLVPNDEVVNPESYENPAYLKKVTWEKFLDVADYVPLMATHKFAVTVVDGHGYESLPYIQDIGLNIESNTADNFKAIGGKGCINVMTEELVNVVVYSTLGQKIISIEVKGDETIYVNPGVYIVNGLKVIIQ